VESINLIEGLTQELIVDIEYEKCGGLVVIEKEEQMDTYGRRVREQQKAGVDVKMLNAEETQRLEPALSDDIAGGAYCPGDKFANPLYLAFGLAEAAKKHGAEIYTNTKVQQIETKHNRVTSVKTDHGTIETEFVVNAAGVAAPEIGKMVDVHIPVKPARGQRVVTEAAPSLITHWLTSADYMNLKQQTSSQDFPVALSGEQTHNGNLLLGITVEPGVYNNSATLTGVKAIIRNWWRTVPATKHIHIIRVFAGLRPKSPDGLPIVGETEVEGFITACGHGGDGVTLAPITGKLIAELLVDGQSSLPLTHLTLSRFDGAK
jgi:sarcosine oxidase subunit beta